MISEKIKQEKKLKGVTRLISESVLKFSDYTSLDSKSPVVKVSDKNIDVKTEEKNTIISIPKNYASNQNIIIEIISKEKKASSEIRLEIGKNSKCTMIIRRKIQSVVYDENLVINSDGNSDVTINSFIDAEVNLGNQMLRVNTSAGLAANAKLKISELAYGSSNFLILQQKGVCDLIGENSLINYKQLCALNKDKLGEMVLIANHGAKNSESNLSSISILNDESKISSIGNIIISPSAKGSVGYEYQSSLLLSEKARADAIPKLEIHNHDVKCSHGSAIKRIDQDQLFYLQSRGLSEKDSKKIISEGLIQPFVTLLDKADQIKVVEEVLKGVLE